MRVTYLAELDNFETVKAAVIAEQAIAVVPETSVHQEVRQGILCMREIAAERMWRPMGAITRRPLPEKAALLEFLSLLTPRAKALLPLPKQ